MRLGRHHGRTHLRSLFTFLALLLEHHGGPALVLGNVFADRLGENFHPGLLLRTAVGVEVNDLTVGEADTETLFDEHVPFFVFSKARLSSATSLGSGGLLESALVIHELGSLCQVDGSTWLACGFVESCELRTFQTEEAATPVLACVSMVLTFSCM